MTDPQRIYPTTATEPRQAQIPREFDQLEKQLAVLSDNIGNLEARLVPVLLDRAAEASGPNQSQPEELRAGVAQQIYQARKTAGGLTERITEILRRLEL